MRANTFGLALALCALAACGSKQQTDFLVQATPLAPSDTVDPPAAAPRFALPVVVQGGALVQGNGQPFKFRAANWYGAEGTGWIPGGLNVRHRDDIARLVAQLGFNSVRLTFSDEMVVNNPVVTQGLDANPDLVGMHALDVLQQVVMALSTQNVGVVLANETTQAGDCCTLPDPCNAKWFNDDLPAGTCHVTQAEEAWVAAWELVVQRMSAYPRFIGVDLRGAVRDANVTWPLWSVAATNAANRLHAVNPNLLIGVGGVQGGEDLSGAGSDPVTPNVLGRVVYTARVFGSFTAQNSNTTYDQADYATFAASAQARWGYLNGSQISAPVWVAEMGAVADGSNGEQNYWSHLVSLMQGTQVGYGAWALNTTHNDGTADTMSILQTDWTKALLDFRTSGLNQLQ